MNEQYLDESVLFQIGVGLFCFILGIIWPILSIIFGLCMILYTSVINYSGDQIDIAYQQILLV